MLISNSSLVTLSKPKEFNQKFENTCRVEYISFIAELASILSSQAWIIFILVVYHSRLILFFIYFGI
ncbi:hypothetical protein HOF65_00315 [bacterium]|nr:hypothetical protein [bacterium]MBT3852493.1 hypothetical protein [bacterium]MBT4632658.1 hypothetical protein [bacterium]MBT6778322.1 hypothetical protein [bacterium]